MKSHRFLNLSIAVCMAAMCMASVAEAQRQGGQGGGRQQRGGQRGGTRQVTISRAQLLRSEDIKEEVNINEAQGATIEAALEAYQKEREAARPDFEAFREMNEEERTAAREKLTKQSAELNKKTDAMLNALLEEDQIKRLDEISLQLRVRFGLASVLKSEDLKKTLSVKDEQIAKLEEIEKEATEARDKMFEEMRAAFRGRGRDGGNDGDDSEREDRPDPRKAMEEARKKVETQVMAVLTDDQKAKLKEMQGTTFEVDIRSLMGGRGGAGGRGGDRGGAGGRGGGGGGDRNRGDGGGGGGRRQRPATDDSAT